jgi:polyribonucleotide nucleotidyltransferase
VATVLSVDNENNPDVAAMLGASAALEISDILSRVPLVGSGWKDRRRFCLQSVTEQMTQSDFSLFLVGRKVTQVPAESPTI